MIRLTEAASDWTGQTFEERLQLAAQTLYVHGFLRPADFSRIENRIRDTADHQRRRQASSQ